MKTTKKSAIKIIGGQYRGRNIPILDGEGLRPSPNRVRETVFNWLQFEISGSTVLDAFSGSGAMGLEALSRGAQSAFFIDKNAEVIQSIKSLLQEWKIQHARCHIADALKLHSNQTRYDYIFLDPPFSLNLHQQAIDHFVNDKFVKPTSKIYIETPFPLDELVLPENYQWHKQSKAGKIYFGIINQVNNLNL